MNLTKAQVIGFFSLPGADLAEINPTAYNSAMAGAPAGAGTCAHCGTGIRHHVVVRTEDGKTAFIGTDCAAKIGGDVAYCAKNGMTAEQKAKRDAETTRKVEAFKSSEAERIENLAAQAKANEALILAAFGHIPKTEGRPLGVYLQDGLMLESRCGEFQWSGYSFFASHIAGLLNGENPALWSNKQKNIFAEIAAKDCGRRNSKAYNAKFDAIGEMLWVE